MHQPERALQGLDIKTTATTLLGTIPADGSQKAANWSLSSGLVISLDPQSA